MREKIDVAQLREMLKIPDGFIFDLMGESIRSETVNYIDRLEEFAVKQYNRDSDGY